MKLHMEKYSGDFILYNLPELFQDCEEPKHTIARKPSHLLMIQYSLESKSIGGSAHVKQWRVQAGVQKWYNNTVSLKVHKIENFFGFDFEICNISLLVMSKY